MSKEIDVTKPVRMKNKIPVELVCTDLSEPYSLLMTFKSFDGNKISGIRMKNGQCFKEQKSEYDLENIPETYDLWVNCYPNDFGHSHRSLEGAIEAATEGCKARIKVKVEVGRFDK